MNTTSNAMDDSFGPREITPTNPSITRPFYWSMQRELWEYRSIYLAPLAVAGVTLFAFLFATIGRSMATPDLNRRLELLEEPYTFTSGIIMGTVFVVGLFYCLDTLSGERRDRSILFWKSLPVSDLTTVLSKAVIPLVILPLVGFVVTFVTQLIMLLLSTLVVSASGLSVSAFWNSVSLFSTSAALLYHLLTVHALWYAPIYGWLLLVSAWARRAAFLWAVLPGFAIFGFEKIAFNSYHFCSWLKYRFGGPEAFDLSMAEGAMGHMSLARFLTTPGLWWGFVFAAIFLFAAARIRRARGPI